MLASDKATLAVARIAIRLIRRPTEHADHAGLFVPAHDAIVGSVAPEKIASISEPHRSFTPGHSSRKAFDAHDVWAVFEKAWIEHLDGRIRITSARLPIANRRLGKSSCCGSASEHAT